MPRPKNAPVRQHFIYNVEKDVSVCQISIAIKAVEPELELEEEDDLVDGNLQAPTNKICGKEVKGDHAMNLQRHVESYHAEVFKLLKLTKDSVNSESAKKRRTTSSLKQSELSQGQQSLNSFVSASSGIFVNISSNFLDQVMLISSTVDGRPFNLANDTGMGMLLKKLYDGFERRNMSYHKQTRKRTQKLIMHNFERLKSEMKKILEGKLISLKIDCAVRKTRCFLGINIQLVLQNRIIVFTLAVVETKAQQTAEHLKTLILNTCNDYGISESNIYSVTSDNGANMLKVIRLLDASVKCVRSNSNLVQSVAPPVENSDHAKRNDSSTNVEVSDDDDDWSVEEMVIEEDESDNVSDINSESPLSNNLTSFHHNADQIESVPDDSIDIDGLDDYQTSAEKEIITLQSIWPENVDASVVGVRCAAHCMQLAIQDTWKTLDDNSINFMDKIRTLVKKMRTKSVVCQFTKIPILDCPTRWTSGETMLSRLLELKNEIIRLALMDSDLYLTSSEWARIESLRDALTPSKRATVMLQKESITIPEFYKVWTCCTIDTKKIDHPFARKLALNLERRQKQMFSNITFLSALYLDPRYKALLTDDQLSAVRLHLRGINMMMDKEQDLIDMDENCMPEHQDTTTSNPDKTNAEDEFNEYLMRAHKARANKNTENSTDRYQFEQFEKNESPSSIPSNMNVLEFWSQNTTRQNYPFLSTVAPVVLGVPCTQCSVERLFSVLKLILNDKRFNLNASSVNAILCIKANYTTMENLNWLNYDVDSTS